MQARSGIADDLPRVDAIYVNAGVTQPSWTWLDALRPGGRLLFPLQPEGGFGGMLLTRRPHRDGTTWPARFVCRAAFIDCEGPHDEATSRRLAAAFARGGEWQAVQSLHLDDEPDETCWCEGND